MIIIMLTLIVLKIEGSQFKTATYPFRRYHLISTIPRVDPTHFQLHMQFSVPSYYRNQTERPQCLPLQWLSEKPSRHLLAFRHARCWLEFLVIRLECWLARRRSRVHARQRRSTGHFLASNVTHVTHAPNFHSLRPPTVQSDLHQCRKHLLPTLSFHLFVQLIVPRTNKLTTNNGKEKNNKKINLTQEPELNRSATTNVYSVV